VVLYMLRKSRTIDPFGPMGRGLQQQQAQQPQSAPSPAEQQPAGPAAAEAPAADAAAAGEAGGGDGAGAAAAEGPGAGLQLNEAQLVGWLKQEQLEQLAGQLHTQQDGSQGQQEQQGGEGKPGGRGQTLSRAEYPPALLGQLRWLQNQAGQPCLLPRVRFACGEVSARQSLLASWCVGSVEPASALEPGRLAGSTPGWPRPATPRRCASSGRTPGSARCTASGWC
jgi:hypothetical protein